jgi:hypothetical protein
VRSTTVMRGKGKGGEGNWGENEGRCQELHAKPFGRNSQVPRLHLPPKETLNVRIGLSFQTRKISKLTRIVGKEAEGG